ncbi:hypothetical protein C7T35_16840 [Variovorax sp. WS11]|nr:hypothetical protein C7T35_16840 [Variovorax sp. WS11]
MEVAWLVFKDRHLSNQKAKKYLDWPMAFANSVKGCWYHLWHVNEEGHADWSKVGVQERRVLEMRMSKPPEQVRKEEDQHAPA